VAKTKDTPSEETAAPAPDQSLPGGGGLTADVYADDRAVTEAAWKDEADRAKAYEVPREALTEEAREATEAGEARLAEEQAEAEERAEAASSPGAYQTTGEDD